MMTFPSSYTHGELGTPGLDAACATSDPPIVCMQDIIDHEYALVESIPDEERAALMPIIRFVRNTLQDPFAALHHGWTMDAIKLTDTAQMHCIDTNYRFHKEMDFLDKKELQGPHSEDVVGERVAFMPRTYAPNGTNNRHSLESCHVSIPWQRVTSRHSSEGLYQQMNCQSALHQKQAHIFDSPQLGNPHSHHSKHDDQANLFQQLRGGFFLSSSICTGLGKPNSLTSFKRDTESNIDHICSDLDMDSFNLEELRRSLRPPAHKMDSDGNDIQSIDVSNCGDGFDGEDDEMHEEDGNNDSYLCYPNQDEEQDASDVEWHLCWGNGMQYHPATAADDRLQFPRVHCRRRNVTKKAVGWIKKRAAQSLVSRVRHKRKCNLPCCTDREMGTKRRKASGYGSRKCARLSTMKKIASSLTAMPSENARKSNRGLSTARTAYGAAASSESCDDKDASQVTQDLDNSPLATALAMVLMGSKGSGLTSCEALQALVQEGYLKAIAYEGQALASQVKTTLKKCPLFKELKNHRFILKAGPKLASNSLHGKVALGGNVAHDRKFSERELSLSHVLYSEKRERSLSQIVDRTLSRKPYQKPHQWDIRCRKTDGNKPGSSYTGHRQQLQAITTATSGCSSCEIVDSCDASNESSHDTKEENMLATVGDSSSGQSAEEQDKDQAEPIRCCRTDGKSWQCSNQAQEGSTYCERHQSRCKKGMVKQHLHVPCESKEKEKLQNKEPTGQNQWVAHERKLSMQLRPRRDATRDFCLKKL